MTLNNYSLNKLTLLILTFLGAVHLSMVYYFADNFFWYDDLIVAIYEVERIYNAPSFSEAFKILIGPFAEHHSMTSRVFFILQTYFNNYEIRFDVIMLMGNFFIFPTIYFFRKIIDSSFNNLLFLIPIAALLLNAQFYEAIYFANGVYCYLVIVFLSVWLIYETSYNQRLWVMILLAILSILTFSSGFFAIAAVFFILFVQKNWAKLFKWTIFFLILSFLFLNKRKEENITEFNPDYIFSIHAIKNTLTHFASIIYFEGVTSKYTLLFFGGISLIIAILFILINTYKWVFKNVQASKNYLFICGILIFAILSGLSIGLLRGSNLDSAAIDTTVLFSRYKFGPMLLLIGNYLILITLINSLLVKKVIWGMVILLIYIPSQIFNFFKIKDFIETMQTHVVNYKISPTKIPKIFNPSDLSQKINITYRPDNYLMKYIIGNKSFLETKNTIPASLKDVGDNMHEISLISSRLKPNLIKNEGEFLFVFSPKDTALFYFNIYNEKFENNKKASLNINNETIENNLDNLYYLDINKNSQYWAKIEKQ